MADSNALAALLMSQQGQAPRRFDPAERSRAYAAKLMEQGSSTAPVQSWGEGLARALTGVAGGVFGGIAERAAEDKQRKNTEGLLDYAGVPAEQRAAMRDLDPQTAAAIAIQLIGKKQEMESLRASAGAQPRIGGSLEPPSPGSISSAPLQPPGAPAPDQATFLQNMSPNARTASAQTGLDPRVVLAQTALETGYGKAAPGNNFFGIKGPGQTLNTTEADASGKLVPTQDSFRTYPDAAASTQGYVDFMKQPNMAGVLQQPGMTGQIAALGKSGYATDPQYAQKIGAIASSLSPLDPTDPQSVFVQGRPGLQGGPTTASGTPIDLNAPAPSFVQPQVAQAPGAPPVTAQATPPGAPSIPPTTLPQVSPEALELQKQADAARATGTAEGLKRSIALSEEAQKIQRAHAVKLQETADTRTYEQRKAAEEHARATAEEQRRFQRGQESEAQKNAREQAEAQAKLTAPQAKEYEDVRKARGEAATLVGALQDYQKSFENAGKSEKIQSIIGMNTPSSTAYNNAALLAKGEALYNLGVLSGPDLDIIRRTLADPSTLRGAKTDPAQVKESVGKVIDLLQSRIVAKEQQLKLPTSDIRKLADDARGIKPPAAGDVVEGYRFKGGNPGDPASWEKAQ